MKTRLTERSERKSLSELILDIFEIVILDTKMSRIQFAQIGSDPEKNDLRCSFRTSVSRVLIEGETN